MGWLFSTQWRDRSDLVRHLRRPERFGDNLELVRACVTGSHHWYLVRERATGLHWIGLDLLQSGRGDGWGYKDLDESVGPTAVDCPLAYLAAPHADRDGWALQWRERVRAYHAGRQARPSPAPGAWVLFGGRAYRLLEPAGPRRGWRVADELGDTYRMQARQLARAEPCENPGAARQAMAA
jgi:hypothetical protein